MKRIFLITISLIVLTCTVSQASEISVDNVIGGWDDGGITKIYPDSLVLFEIRYINNSGMKIIGIQNGFRVWTTDGSDFIPLTITDIHPDFYNYFDWIILIGDQAVDGTGADTISIGASLSNEEAGMPTGFNDIAFRINTGGLPEGETLCIDSSWFPPAGTWMWVDESSFGFSPSWSGPHCYRVVPPPAVPNVSEVRIAQVNGSWDDNGITKIYADSAISFDIRYMNNSGVDIESIFNGFKIWTTGGTRFTPVTAEIVFPDLGSFLDGGNSIMYAGADGLNADTVSLSGFRLFAPGLPTDFNEVVLRINTGGIEDGETLCIDSSWFPLSGVWRWEPIPEVIAPSWSGPYCFTTDTSNAVPSEVLIDQVNGGWVDNGITRILPNYDISFDIRYINNAGKNIQGIINGFRIWTTGGSNFIPPTITDINPDLYNYFDLANGVGYGVVDGIDYDTIGFYTTGGNSLGLPIDFNEVVFRINTGGIPEGETLCIDSAFFSPVLWIWYHASVDIFPSQSGPHCYTAKMLTGDINNDGNINISDLVFMIAFMFQNGSPPNPLLAADINGDSNITITDLVYLVAFMFQGGPPPVG